MIFRGTASTEPAHIFMYGRNHFLFGQKSPPIRSRCRQSRVMTYRLAVCMSAVSVSIRPGRAGRPMLRWAVRQLRAIARFVCHSLWRHSHR